MGRSNRRGLPSFPPSFGGFPQESVRASSIEDIISEVDGGGRLERAREAIRRSGVVLDSLRQAASGRTVLDIDTLDSEVDGFLRGDVNNMGEMVLEDPESARDILTTFYEISPEAAEAIYEEASEEEDIDDSIEKVIDNLDFTEPLSGRDVVERHLRPTQPAFREYEAEDGSSVFVKASSNIDPETSELYPIQLPNGTEIWQGNVYRGTLSCREDGKRNLDIIVRCEERHNEDGSSFRVQAGGHEVVLAEAFGDGDKPQRTVARIRRDGQAEDILELSSEEVADAGGAEGWALLEFARGLRQKDDSSQSSVEFDPTDTGQQIDRLLA